MLKVNSSGFAELFLFFLSNGFKSPENLAYKVIFVDDIYGIFEIYLRNVRAGTPHVTDKMSGLRTVKPAEVSCKLTAAAGGENICNPVVSGSVRIH